MIKILKPSLKGGLIFLFWLKFLKDLDPLLPARPPRLPKQCCQLEANIQSMSLGRGQSQIPTLQERAGAERPLSPIALYPMQPCCLSVWHEEWNSGHESPTPSLERSREVCTSAVWEADCGSKDLVIGEVLSFQHKFPAICSIPQAEARLHPKGI